MMAALHTPANLGQGCVHLWRIPLTGAVPDLAAQALVLSADEAHQAGRFRFDRDRQHYVLAHIALRRILAGYLDCAPGQVTVETGAHGKPLLAASNGLSFNLSHSHELALLGVTRAGEIGVDVEYIRPLEQMGALAERCFSARELQGWRALPEPERHAAFFHAWARKEALIKAVGEGLYYPLQDFTVSLAPGEPAGLLEIEGSAAQAREWQLQAVDVQAGYAAAFALRTAISAQPMLLEYSHPFLRGSYATQS